MASTEHVDGRANNFFQYTASDIHNSCLFKKNIHRSSEESQHVVFADSHQMYTIKTQSGVISLFLATGHNFIRAGFLYRSMKTT